MPTAIDELLTDGEVTQLLKLQRNTLACWRARGRGPAFIKLGGKIVRYQRSAIDAFIAGTSAPKRKSK